MNQWQQRERARDLLAKEVGYVRKPHGGRLRVALAFPNTYFVGMSNLGFQTVYKLFNAEDGIVCERVFLPPKSELAAQRAVGRAARHARVADAGPRLRRPGVLGVVRVGLHQRADDAAAGRHPAARRRAHAPRSAGDDWRRRDLREPRAAGAVCRRHRRRRRRGADPAAASRRSRRRRDRDDLLRRLARSAATTCRRSTTCTTRDDGTIDAFVPKAGTGAPAGRAQGRAQDHRGRRSAGDDDLHARHRVRLAVPGRSRARLRQPVPVLLGRLQLPAGARVSRRSGSCSWPKRRGRIRTASAWCRSRCAITPTSRRSSRGWSEMGYSISPASLRLDDLTPTHPASCCAQSGERTITIAPETGSDRLRRVINKTDHQRRDPGRGRDDLRGGLREPEAVLT